MAEKLIDVYLDNVKIGVMKEHAKAEDWLDFIVALGFDRNIPFNISWSNKKPYQLIIFTEEEERKYWE